MSGKKKLAAGWICFALLLVVGVVGWVLSSPSSQQLDLTLSGVLLTEDGTAVRTAAVTIRGRYDHYMLKNHEDQFLGGYDGGIYLDGALLTNSLVFFDKDSEYASLTDGTRDVRIIASREFRQILAEVSEGETTYLLVAPAQSEEEAAQILEQITALPEYQTYWSDFV